MADSANGKAATGSRRRRGSSPRSANRPTVPQVRPLVEALYAMPDGGVGGPLHIVLDDGNIKDGNIAWCIDWANHSHFGYTEGTIGLSLEIGRLMLQMSPTQRRKIVMR